ncbi:MAG TPA: family 20 glycosylhydrolase, partial [Armatimonadota bacterium]|nr:family 20 glycosylhydrolase [Armatimonadota bacterium]
EEVSAPGAHLSDEAYRLGVSALGAAVAARSGRGLLWGAMSLWQMLARHEGAVVAPGVRITDWPRYPWRGFMCDSGRAPNSLDKLRRILRICSAFKLNLLLFREGDDELNAVRYNGLPLGSRNPCPLTMDEVAALTDHAEGLGVTLVPEIEALGHSNAKGMHYPDLVAGGIETAYEGIGVHRRKVHLLPGDPRVLALLEGMLDEWAPQLRSPYLHLGLDEVLMPREPQAEHLARLLDVVERTAARHGRDLRPVVWADAPPTPDAWRDRVVRCLWSYAEHAGHGRICAENAHLVRQGIVELSQAGAAQPVWMAGGSGSRHTPYTKSPDSEAIANLAEWATWGEDLPNYAGLLAVQWSGNMVDDWLPDFLAAAEYGWHPPEVAPSTESELVRMRAALARLRDAANPAPGTVDQPAWDGIWLDGRHWREEIVPRAR